MIISCYIFSTMHLSASIHCVLHFNRRSVISAFANISRYRCFGECHTFLNLSGVVYVRLSSICAIICTFSIPTWQNTCILRDTCTWIELVSAPLGAWVNRELINTPEMLKGRSSSNKRTAWKGWSQVCYLHWHATYRRRVR